jgi:hypothetical protein
VRHISVAAGLMGLVAASAQAQNQGQPQAQPPLHASFGAGGTLCSQYTWAARSSDILHHQASNWLLGYVSGMNAASRSPGQVAPLDRLTGDQVLRAATEYCEANPTATIASAANVWYAAAPKPAAPPQQAEAKDDDNWIRLNLTAPARKPLLDRR